MAHIQISLNFSGQWLGRYRQTIPGSDTRNLPELQLRAAPTSEPLTSGDGSAERFTTIPAGAVTPVQMPLAATVPLPCITTTAATSNSSGSSGGGAALLHSPAAIGSGCCFVQRAR